MRFNCILVWQQMQKFNVSLRSTFVTRCCYNNQRSKYCATDTTINYMHMPIRWLVFLYWFWYFSSVKTNGFWQKSTNSITWSLSSLSTKTYMNAIIENVKLVKRLNFSSTIWINALVWPSHEWVDFPVFYFFYFNFFFFNRFVATFTLIFERITEVMTRINVQFNTNPCISSSLNSLGDWYFFATNYCL